MSSAQHERVYFLDRILITSPRKHQVPAIKRGLTRPVLTGSARRWQVEPVMFALFSSRSPKSGANPSTPYRPVTAPRPDEGLICSAVWNGAGIIMTDTVKNASPGRRLAVGGRQCRRMTVALFKANLRADTLILRERAGVFLPRCLG